MGRGWGQEAGGNEGIDWWAGGWGQEAGGNEGMIGGPGREGGIVLFL